MTNTAHTPGPWRSDWQFIVAPDPAGVHHDIYIAEIAETDEDERVATSEQQKANARLIAAAPELLFALIELADLVENNLVTHEVHDDAWEEELARTLAAIAKAKGGAI